MSGDGIRGSPALFLHTAPVHRLLPDRPIAGSPRPAVFLDRDGVVNVDRHYVNRIQDFEFMPSVLAACGMLSAAGFALVVVTNQAGIARGMYGIEEFQRLSEWMAARLAEAGALLDGIYFCPHHPRGSISGLSRPCACRKPEPGMILAAAQDLRLDLSRSALIGDKWSDIVAGRSAGVGSCLLFRAAAGSAVSDRDLDVDAVDADRQVANLMEAAEYLVNRPGEFKTR